MTVTLMACPHGLLRMKMAKQKQKVTVNGMVGWSLLQTAQHHGMLEHVVHGESPWDYLTFGEGPNSAEDHVIISKEYFEKLPTAGYQEQNMLVDQITEDLAPNSRLASYVILEKDLDGITAIVPETNPDFTNYV